MAVATPKTDANPGPESHSPDAAERPNPAATPDSPVVGWGVVGIAPVGALSAEPKSK